MKKIEQRAHGSLAAPALLRDESGAVALEYGLLASICVIGLITSFTFLGGRVDSFFSSISSGFSR